MFFSMSKISWRTCSENYVVIKCSEFTVKLQYTIKKKKTCFGTTLIENGVTCMFYPNNNNFTSNNNEDHGYRKS